MGKYPQTETIMQPQHESKTKLLDATLKVVRAKGYSATRIEDVCAEAGLTKGSFFHHFKSKEDLALSAIAHWDATTSVFFATAPYHDAADPLSRVIAYIEFRKALLTGDLPDFTCFVGTIVQETYQTHPEVSAAAAGNISSHAKTLEADIVAAMREHGASQNWTPESLALHLQAVIQGSFILAKAKGSAAAAAESLDHLRRYIELVFQAPAKTASGRKDRLHDQVVSQPPDGEPKAITPSSESSDPATQPCTTWENSLCEGLWTTLLQNMSSPFLASSTSFIRPAVTASGEATVQVTIASSSCPGFPSRFARRRPSILSAISRWEGNQREQSSRGPVSVQRGTIYRQGRTSGGVVVPLPKLPPAYGRPRFRLRRVQT